MPAVRKTFVFDPAALCLFVALGTLGASAGSLSAEETLEPQTLRVPSDARGLNDSPYRTNATLPGSAKEPLQLDASVSNDVAGERPASFEARVPADHALVPWTKAPRSEDQPPSGRDAQPAANDLSGQVLQPKQPLQQKTGGTLALRRSNSDEKNTAPRGASSGLGTMFASLFLVLGLFFLAAWMLKRGMPKGASLLPSEVVEVLGRAPLSGKQQVHLLRIGNKMLLVAISAGGAETLTEITDPLEIDRLAGLCQQQSPHSSTNAFRHIFQQFARRGDAELLDEPTAVQGPTGKREVLHG